MTSDGVLVVLHDGTLNRTVRGDAANCTGAVSSKTLAQIKTCDAGLWFGAEWAGQKVPTLEEVFQRYGQTVSYYIETKTPDARGQDGGEAARAARQVRPARVGRPRLAGADPVLQRGRRCRSCTSWTRGCR